MKKLLMTIGAALTALMTFSSAQADTTPAFQVGETSYATFEAALAAASDMEAPATIKMVANYAGTIAFDAEEDSCIILDLAGHTITPSDTYAINTGCAFLTITNSTGTIGTVGAGTAGSVYVEAGTELTIYAGIFEGEVFDDSDYSATITLYGGSYASEDSETFYLADCVAEGYPETYADGKWTVGSTTPATYDIQCSGTENCGTVSVTVNGDTATAAAEGDTVTIVATPNEGYYVSAIAVTDGNQESVEVTDGAFTMPAAAVTVNVTFAEGMAKLNDTWYASFEDAYSHASAQSDTMVIKISGDFSPVLDGSRTFTTVTFTNTNTSAESISIDTLYNDYTFKAYNWNFPTNATLLLSGEYTLASANGGTLNILEGAKITINGTSTLNGIAGVIGAGELISPPNPTYFITGSNLITQKMLTNELWTGTFELRGNYGTGAITLSDMANNGSAIRFNGFTVGSIGTSGATYGMDLVLKGDGLTVGGDYTHDQIYLSGALSGSGALNIAAAQAKILRLNFTGDVSGFTGDILNTNSYARIVFGGTSGAGGGSISVVNGASVTNASTATWIANDIVLINGELVANGTMTVSGSLCGANGDGVYRANTTTADINSFGSTWNGTYVIGYSPSDAFNPNSFGNANSTVALAADLASGAYFGSGSKEALTINPTVRLDTDVTIKNGYSHTNNSYVVTFTKLTGSGNFTTSQGNDSSNLRWYAINTLADYTGTLNVVANSCLSIASVDLDAAPEAGAVVIPATVGGTLDGDLAVKVGGKANGQTLVYDSAKGGLVLAAAGYDNGDGGTFTIESTKEATLIAALPNGKTSLGDAVSETSSLTYAQAYALGLWDENAEAVADLDATITVAADGKVTVTLANAPVEGYTVTCKVYEKASLTDDWPTTVAATYAYGSETAFTPTTGAAGFYKIAVVIANSAE